MQTGVRTTGSMFTRVLGWKVEEFEIFAAKALEEIQSKKRHMWMEV